MLLEGITTTIRGDNWGMKHCMFMVLLTWGQIWCVLLLGTWSSAVVAVTRTNGGSRGNKSEQKYLN